MKRRIPALHATQPIEEPLEGLFLVRVSGPPTAAIWKSRS